jgi:hypothetical protein
MPRLAVEQQRHPTYLQPYTRAVKRHGAEFALLWASPKTQRQRFEAIVDLVDPTGLMLDLGVDGPICSISSSPTAALYRHQAVTEWPTRHANIRTSASSRRFLQDPVARSGADVICAVAHSTRSSRTFLPVPRQAFAAPACSIPLLPLPAASYRGMTGDAKLANAHAGSTVRDITSPVMHRCVMESGRAGMNGEVGRIDVHAPSPRRRWLQDSRGIDRAHVGDRRLHAPAPHIWPTYKGLAASPAGRSTEGEFAKQACR